MVEVIRYEALQVEIYEVKSPTNKISRDEIDKKIKYIKGSKKYIIKWMRVKIKIKNKLEDKPEVSIGGLDWNEKYLWLKKKQIKRMRVKLEKQ